MANMTWFRHIFNILIPRRTTIALETRLVTNRGRTNVVNWMKRCECIGYSKTVAELDASVYLLYCPSVMSLAGGEGRHLHHASYCPPRYQPPPRRQSPPLPPVVRRRRWRRQIDFGRALSCIQHDFSYTAIACISQTRLKPLFIHLICRISGGILTFPLPECLMEVV